MTTKKLLEWGLVPLMIFAIVTMTSPWGQSNPGIPYGQDDELFVHVNILNHQDDDLDDAKLQMFIYETDSYASSGFDLNENSNTGKMLMFNYPEAEPDYYPVRMTLTDDHNNRFVKHTWVWIG